MYGAPCLEYPMKPSDLMGADVTWTVHEASQMGGVLMVSPDGFQWLPEGSPELRLEGQRAKVRSYFAKQREIALELAR